VKLTVFCAQLIFAVIGIFFTFSGLMGQLTFKPSMWYSGPQPIVLVFIGLPFIAVTLLLVRLHKSDDKDLEKDVSLLQLARRCPNCNALNDEKARFCNNCGSELVFS
jgi:hypothetical protein